MKSPREVIQRAMQRRSKNDPEVNYSPTRGKPNHHCGPDQDWPHGYCKFFEKPDSCDKVLGIIAPKGGCLLFKKAEWE